jgi:predicted PurR-regulated permease PerM
VAVDQQSRPRTIRPTESTPPARVAVAPRTIVLLVALALGSVVLLAAVYALRTIVIQLILAIVLAMAAEPLVRLFERRGAPRGRAVGISFALVAIVLFAFGYLLVRPLVDESTRFVHDAPALVQHLSRGDGRLGFLETRFHVVEHTRDAVDSGHLTAAAGPAWGVVSSAVQTVGALVFIAFLTLFLQLGGRQWFESFVKLAPERDRARIRRAGSGISTAVGGYVTGNLLISVIAGTVTTLTLLALSVPYAVVLGVIVAIFDLIPLVGATAGTIVVAAVALGTRGLAAAAIAVVVMIVYQQVENHVLQQLVYHRTVKLSPLAIALSVAAGAELAGVPGALLGIPFAGALKVVSQEVVAWRRGEDAPA